MIDKILQENIEFVSDLKETKMDHLSFDFGYIEGDDLKTLRTKGFEDKNICTGRYFISGNPTLIKDTDEESFSHLVLGQIVMIYHKEINKINFGEEIKYEILCADIARAGIIKDHGLDHVLSQNPKPEDLQTIAKTINSSDEEIEKLKRPSELFVYLLNATKLRKEPLVDFAIQIYDGEILDSNILLETYDNYVNRIRN